MPSHSRAVSYIYRVAALNYDGSAATPAVGTTLTQVADLVSPPVATVTLGAAVDATGIVAGTYYVKYSAWLNSTAGGTTAASGTRPDYRDDRRRRYHRRPAGRARW